MAYLFEDTDGDGTISYRFGHHGAAHRDQPRPHLFDLEQGTSKTYEKYLTGRPDGSYAALLGEDSVWLVDAAAGKVRDLSKIGVETTSDAKLLEAVRVDEGVSAAATSADDEWWLAATLEGQGENGYGSRMARVRVGDGRIEVAPPVVGDIQGVGDGRWAYALGDGYAAFLDVQTGRVRRVTGDFIEVEYPVVAGKRGADVFVDPAEGVFVSTQSGDDAYRTGGGCVVSAEADGSHDKVQKGPWQVRCLESDE